MIDALAITWRSLKDLWEDFVLLLMLNVVWSLAVVLPVASLLLLGSTNLFWSLALSLWLLLPLPIVSGALCFVTNQVTRGKSVGWGTFITGIRRYWAKSLIVALINVVVLVLLATNIQFYGAILQGTWTNFVLSIWLLLGGYWLLVQVFWFPMILELESEKVLKALRNALLMALATPGFSLTLSILIVVIIVLSILLTMPAMLFTTALLLLIANHATRSRLAYAQKVPYEPGSAEE